MVQLAIDLLGADTPEEALCAGALRALEANGDLFLHLFGHAERLSAMVSASPARARAELVDCAATVTNYDDSMTAYQQTDASIVKAMRLTAENDAVSSVITCGSTGAAMVCAIRLLGRRRGTRPVLAVELIARGGQPLLLLDCGANIDAHPEHYVFFAETGSEYMRRLGYAAPRVALLSNGAEDTKGCEAVKAANALLHQQDGLNFIGNIEATHALSGKTDVIVCDGFHGNILLKSIEGTAKTVLAEVEERLAGLDCRDTLQAIRRKYDYNTQGGAILLGVNKPVMKGHGSATGEAMEHMISRACQIAR